MEWKAKEFNFETRFIALAGETNRRMPSFVRHKAWRVLNNMGIALSKAKILIIGAAYKKDLGDCRESPAIAIMQQLCQDGVTVAYHDPYVAEIEIFERIFYSVELEDETVADADLVIIATDHSNLDYLNIVKQAQAVLDTRGVTRKLACDRNKITLL